MLNEFKISKNSFLKADVVGYYNRDYTKYGQKNNPDFLCTLKNLWHDKATSVLKEASDEVISILLEDIPLILEKDNIKNCMLASVPRSKLGFYEDQLMFRYAVQIATKKLMSKFDITDGTNCITRIKDTRTTHIKKEVSSTGNPVQFQLKGGKASNTGERPYSGITKDTCNINSEQIQNKNIILIDDIYTKTVNIDEDCIQALLDNGAKNVIFYAIAKTTHESDYVTY